MHIITFDHHYVVIRSVYVYLCVDMYIAYSYYHPYSVDINGEG